MISLRIEGKCPSKKNSRDVKLGRKSKKTGKRTLYPAKKPAVKLYEKHAPIQLRAQWGDRAPLKGLVGIQAHYFFSGNEPDILGFLETVFDVLEYAGIVENDRQLVPYGQPAATRTHVKTGEEHVLIDLITWENE